MKKKNNLLLVIMLIVVAGGMFAYQNFVLPAQQIAQKTVVYIANKDIPADAKLTANLFKPVEVTVDSVVEGSIQNLETLEGKRLIGGLLKGEPLMQQRLSEQLEEVGTFYVKVEPDFPVDLRQGEAVAVMQKTENAVDVLFERKIIYSTSQITNILEGESVSGFYLLLTQEELEDYYIAKENGGVIMTKIEVTAMSEKQPVEVAEPVNEDKPEVKTESTVVPIEPSSNHSNPNIEENTAEEMSQVATLADVDANGNGTVTISEAKAAGFSMPIDQNHWLYEHMIDNDGDGVVGEEN